MVSSAAPRGFPTLLVFSLSHPTSRVFRRGYITRKFLNISSQRLALFIGGLCHDIDHRGYNNAFMINSKTPLGSLYSSSTMEWHHFKQGVFLLEVSGYCKSFQNCAVLKNGGNVVDVTSVGQHSSPWPPRCSVKVEIKFHFECKLRSPLVAENALN